jgi:acyl-CoA synthetase (AMP-forming)/AMP-acid ligase II
VALVHQASYSPQVTELLPELPDLRLVITVDDGSGQTPPAGAVPYEDAMAEGGPERDFAPRSNDDHYILYTGGTTGLPKGVVWRHEDVFYALGGGVDPHTNTRVQRPEEMVEKGRGGQITLLPIAPLMHGATQWSILGQSFVGNRTILVPKFDPHEVWHLVAEEKANSIMITGDAMGKPLVEALDDPEAASHDLSSLMAITSSAALFSAPVKDEFFKHFPNIVIVDAIGSSESGNNGMVSMGKGNTAMKSGPTVSVLGNTVVFDEDMKVVPPGSGIIGKIARYGDIPVGYYNDPIKTAEVFIHVEGTRYVMPGDFATVEEDGSITLLGRGSVSINSGGEKIFPEEVESAVRSHPEVFDAIVVGAPDDRWGQRVAAIIQPRADKHPTLEDIQEHCREAIAGYKVPRQLHVVETIVRSPSGKPDYRWAADIVAEVPEETDSGGLRTSSGQ